MEMNKIDAGGDTCMSARDDVSWARPCKLVKPFRLTAFAFALSRNRKEIFSGQMAVAVYSSRGSDAQDNYRPELSKHVYPQQCCRCCQQWSSRAYVCAHTLKCLLNIDIESDAILCVVQHLQVLPTALYIQRTDTAL